MDLFKTIVGYSRSDPEYIKRAFRKGVVEGCLFGLLTMTPIAVVIVFLVYAVTR